MLSGFPRWIGVDNVRRADGRWGVIEVTGRRGTRLETHAVIEDRPGPKPATLSAERRKLHGRRLLTSEAGSAVDVVLYTSQMIDLIHVFILAPHQHGDVVIDRGCEINHQSHIVRLMGVAILVVIGFATGHMIEQKQRAVLPLSPITRQQQGNVVFTVGTHGLQKPIVAQQIFIGFRSSQL